MMVTRRPGWAFSLAGPAGPGEALRHGRPGGLRLRRGAADDKRSRPPAPCWITSPKRRKLAGPHRPAGALPQSGTLEIDQSSRRSLEITRTIREGRREGSLLAVLGPHGDGHGRAAAGRLAGQSADRGGGDSRPARGRRRVGGRGRAGRRSSRGPAAGLRRRSGCWPA